jgi:hypothetical protein
MEKLVHQLAAALKNHQYNPRACIVVMRTNGTDCRIDFASSDPVSLAKRYRKLCMTLDPTVWTLEFRSAGKRIPVE